MALIFAVSISCWIVLLMMPTVFGWDWEDNRSLMRYSLLFLQMWLATVGMLAYFGVSNLMIDRFVPCTVSLNVCGMNVPLRFEMKHPLLRQSSVLPRSPSASRSKFRSSAVRQVLADDREFNAFMAHLFAEFSYENALCLIECTRFRDRVQRLHGVMADDVRPIIFCQSIRNTRSTLVKQLAGPAHIRAVALLIAQKYLRNGSAYQVNVPWKMLSEVLQTLDDPSVSIDSTIFDAVIGECIYLLRDSMQRFQQF